MFDYLLWSRAITVLALDTEAHLSAAWSLVE